MKHSVDWIITMAWGIIEFLPVFIIGGLTGWFVRYMFEVQ